MKYCVLTIGTDIESYRKHIAVVLVHVIISGTGVAI